MGRRRAARHFVESPDRWAERRRGPRSGRGDLCVWGRDARHAAFPTWGVMRRKQTRPRWRRDAILVKFCPETFTIHSTYLTETRPSADKSRARARSGAAHTLRRNAEPRTINSRQSAEFHWRVCHGFFAGSDSTFDSTTENQDVSRSRRFSSLHVNVPISCRKLVSAKIYCSLGYSEDSASTQIERTIYFDFY